MSPKGYALFIVLLFMVLLFILTTSVILRIHSSAGQAVAATQELNSLAAADSGIQYALERIRQKIPLQSSAAAAHWHLLQIQKDSSVCFKVFSLSNSSHQEVIESYGELTRNGCGEHLQDSENLLSAKILKGIIDLNHGSLSSWQEVLP
jgi:hypothetical protein